MIKQLFSTTSVKQYGSQANSLALDSSDVDLAVTGLNVGSSFNTQMQHMNKFFLKVKQLTVL
jgi:DNA polymerase sigma